MTDLAENIKNQMNTTPPMIRRYMIEIKTYPNGNEYVRAWLVGKSNLVKKPKKPKKSLKESKVTKEEVY